MTYSEIRDPADAAASAAPAPELKDAQQSARSETDGGDEFHASEDDVRETRAPLPRLGRFLNNMDARATTSLLVSAALFGFVIFMFAYGEGVIRLDGELELREWLVNASESVWAPVAVVAIYIVLGLTGFPQFFLIGATVFAFRDELPTGIFYAWAATMASASFNFALGHFFGAGIVRRFGGARLNALSVFVGRRGILASGIVRVVPSAPFIVVNMAAGLSHIPYWKFALGTGVGILPKILMIALVGASALEFFLSRNPRDLVMIVVMIAAWLAILYGARKYYLRVRAKR